MFAYTKEEFEGDCDFCIPVQSGFTKEHEMVADHWSGKSPKLFVKSWSGYIRLMHEDAPAVSGAGEEGAGRLAGGDRHSL